MFPMLLHYVQTLESAIQQDLDFCQVAQRGKFKLFCARNSNDIQSRARDLWREMLDIRTGGKKDAAKLARIVMAQVLNLAFRLYSFVDELSDGECLMFERATEVLAQRKLTSEIDGL